MKNTGKLIIYIGDNYSTQEAIDKVREKMKVMGMDIKPELDKLLRYLHIPPYMTEDLISIRCPEVYKTPQEQIHWARELVKIVNIGYTIYLATMSDYIVRELSNCIMLNNLDSLEGLEHYGYENCHKLDSNKVEAYEVDCYNKNPTYIPYKVTSKQGIFATFFDEAIDKQNESQGAIFEKMNKQDKGFKVKEFFRAILDEISSHNQLADNIADRLDLEYSKDTIPKYSVCFYRKIDKEKKIPISDYEKIKVREESIDDCLFDFYFMKPKESFYLEDCSYINYYKFICKEIIYLAKGRLE